MGEDHCYGTEKGWAILNHSFSILHTYSAMASSNCVNTSCIHTVQYIRTLQGTAVKDACLTDLCTGVQLNVSFFEDVADLW